MNKKKWLHEKDNLKVCKYEPRHVVKNTTWNNVLFEILHRVIDLFQVICIYFHVLLYL